MLQDAQRVTLNIGGHHFTTFKDTLTKYPETLLGRMFATDQRLTHSEIPFFDRSHVLFDAILNFYRTGLLIKPEFVHEEVWEDELNFWILPIKASPDRISLMEKKLEHIIKGSIINNKDVHRLIELYVEHQQLNPNKFRALGGDEYNY